MKLFKKTAALLFCLALIVSVMAISASADDEAQLLEGLAEPVPNAAFTVTLEKVDYNNASVTGEGDTTNGSFAGIAAATTNNILDRDYSDSNKVDTQKGYEIKKATDVTFAIKLAYTGSAFTPYANSAGNTINGFQFTYDAGSSSSSDANNNKGVTISGLNIWGQDVYALRQGTDFTANESPYAQYANVYAFGALGNGANDIPMPDETPIIIGAITFSFDSAAQAQALTPTIKTMLVQVRNNQHPQWIVKAGVGATYATEGGTAEYPYGPATYVTTGNPGSGFTAPTPAGISGYADGTASTYPIWVNPYYEITVHHLHANPDTGVAELVTASNKLVIDNTDESNPVYENVTSKVNYYFDQTDTHSTSGANTLTNEANIPGYTFQGWMVTENSTKSNTWDAYVNSGNSNKDGDWDEETSYKQRVTASTLTDAMKAVKTSWKAWNADNESNVAFVDITTRDTAMSNNPDGSTASGVKFIPKATSGTTVTITTGYVGPITLTPVYTRDAYTVTFKADDFTKNTNSKATFSKTTTTKERTDYYTIEDLANASDAAVDYLNIAYTEGTTPFIAQTGDNKDLNKPGYKFVGWVPSNGTVADADKTATDQNGTVTKLGYDWRTDSTTRVNSTPVIRNNTGASGAANQIKHYGNLTLTAEWELDIYFAKLEYSFGGADNVLALIAVPNANRIANYTYNYTKTTTNSETDATTTTNYAMFEIKNEDGKGQLQRAAYMTAAIKAESTDDDAKKDTANTITSALFGTGKTYASADSYHLFAYIVPAATKEKDFTLNEASQTTGNDDIRYDGDVDGSEFVSVADFGNVDTLLVDPTATTSGIFTITEPEGVKARLKADMSTANDNADQKDDNGDYIRKFASIADVKAIYNVMGYNAQNTPTPAPVSDPEP